MKTTREFKKKVIKRGKNGGMEGKKLSRHRNGY